MNDFEWSKQRLFCRVEKERNAIAGEMEETSRVLQSDQAEKTVLEKNGKMISSQINDMQVRVEEMQRALHEADGSKRKLMVEQCDLTHHLEEAERTLHQLSKDKTSLTTQLDDSKRLADAETRVNELSISRWFAYFYYFVLLYRITQKHIIFF